MVNFEKHSKISFISTNWRPVEAIAYMSDKVTRVEGSGGGKASEKQSGFLFFENRYGFNFKSLDALCLGDGIPKEEDIFEYTYIQQGNDPPNNGYHTIESISYPDRANHLRNMRMGTFKTTSLSISLPRPTNSNATDSGNQLMRLPLQGLFIVLRNYLTIKCFLRQTPYIKENLMICLLT